MSWYENPSPQTQCSIEKKSGTDYCILLANASRDDDARSCPDTAVHASGLHPNRSHCLSYLPRKIADMTQKILQEREDKHMKNEQTVDQFNDWGRVAGM